MDLERILESVQITLLGNFRQLQAETLHRGDRGHNAEKLLLDFLRPRLPLAYGLAKGEVLFPDGSHSHAADIIVYDNLRGSPLTAGNTVLIPISSVFGLIEVKSTLTKAELRQSLELARIFGSKIADRQVRNPLGPGIYTRFNASRPFMSIFGFQLGDNSLQSLLANLIEFEVPEVLESINMVAVLGTGVISRYVQDITSSEMKEVYTYEELTQAIRHRLPDKTFHLIGREHGDRTLGAFYFQLISTLGRMQLGLPDYRDYFASDREK